MKSKMCEKKQHLICIHIFFIIYSFINNSFFFLIKKQQRYYKTRKNTHFSRFLIFTNNIIIFSMSVRYVGNFKKFDYITSSCSWVRADHIKIAICFWLINVFGNFFTLYPSQSISYTRCTSLSARVEHFKETDKANYDFHRFY